MPQRVRIGRTPVAYTMDAADGEVVLRLTKEGFETKQIAVAAGHDRDLAVTLTRVVVKAPAHDHNSPEAGYPGRSTMVGDHSSPEAGSAGRSPTVGDHSSPEASYPGRSPTVGDRSSPEADSAKCSTPVGCSFNPFENLDAGKTGQNP